MWCGVVWWKGGYQNDAREGRQPGGQGRGKQVMSEEALRT
jgi:hypothetical protein